MDRIQNQSINLPVIGLQVRKSFRKDFRKWETQPTLAPTHSFQRPAPYSHIWIHMEDLAMELWNLASQKIETGSSHQQKIGIELTFHTDDWGGWFGLVASNLRIHPLAPPKPIP